MNFFYFIFTMYFLCLLPYRIAKINNNALLDNVIDVKDFKKLLRTKTNVLVCFTSNLKQSGGVVKVLKEAAVAVKGQGTLVLVDCSGEAKKMCKKLKVTPDTYVLKHYKDGEFNKDYDRKESVTSLINFMRDPTGDLPWEEDSSFNSIVHISDSSSLAKFIKRETKPILIMFYAPWCSFCKNLKPEFASAADELQGEAVLAAIDVNRPQNTGVRAHYNITGFPTLLYYEGGVLKYQYDGENNKVGIVSFIRNPHASTPKPRDVEWSDTDSDVVHLTATNFDPVTKEEASVLVLFYAPWCGHCKMIKPEYENAAAKMKLEKIPGMLAAVDATKESALATRYNIKGYPSLKYFSYGEVKFDVNSRESATIVELMKDPKAPPPPPPPEISWADEKSDVVHLTEENFKQFVKKKKHVLVMFYVPWCGHCKSAKPEFTEAAAKFRDDPKVEFAAVDCTTQQNLCTANDVKGYPTIKYFSYSKTVKLYTGSRSAENFINFMANPESKSQPSVNKDEWVVDAKTIIQLTDNTFKKEISSEEPVLVMFYAPWCGHCKRLKPDYAKAAEDLKAEGVKGRLAILDCTKNPETTEKYEIAGYPTLKLFKNGKFIKDYKGNRTHEDLKQFMKDPESFIKDEL